ncbi:hydantoinase/oxoprolinase family protein [Neobacillus sp. NPDC097160]|uniref:hydantoinase/oxoprolinase family protein n=1 Tax=Neobacillus sp. NPDC097160 TaxID=3364298 RepID=UPI00380F9D75
MGGVRTNFRMPDIISIGIGGGSIVRNKNGVISVGPDSVGYNITKESLAFGGTTLTATDCLIASGMVKIDHPECDPSRVSSLDPAVWNGAIEVIQEKVSEAIDKMKTNKQDVPVVLVGGGAILIQGDIKGASEVILPENSGCANALGAAIAQVSGEIDKMFSFPMKKSPPQ